MAAVLLGVPVANSRGGRVASPILHRKDAARGGPADSGVTKEASPRAASSNGLAAAKAEGS
jgi:hypothetical protein